MSDQITCTVPPRIWTELPGGAGYVFSNGDTATTVTVRKGGEIEFGAPMRWRPDLKVIKSANLTEVSLVGGRLELALKDVEYEEPDHA